MALVAASPDLVRGNDLAVITPNKPEFDNLWRSVFPTNATQSVELLAKELGITVIQKGNVDRIGMLLLNCIDLSSSSEFADDCVRFARYSLSL